MSEGAAGPGAERAKFLEMVGDLQPELHRYCARLTGSVIDSEDVVQDTLVKAFAALQGIEAPQAFRSWLFRIAHNQAVDLLRSRAIRSAETLSVEGEAVPSDAPDAMERMMHQEAMNTAIARFVELPVAQRSAVILKDVLDHSLGDIATLLGTSVDAVKAHLARGRARLRQLNSRPAAAPPPHQSSKEVRRYVEMFNRRDWEGLRALLADDVKLRQATRPVRSGIADVGMFFTFYAGYEPVHLMPAALEGREVIAVFESGLTKAPSYFMWLEWRDEKITFIHDYRYARYVMRGADLVMADNFTDDAKPAHEAQGTTVR